MKQFIPVLLLVLMATKVYPQCMVYFFDNDHDGYGGGLAAVYCSTPNGWSTIGGDCNDGNPDMHPGAYEICNQADDDCDGSIDEGLPANTYYLDFDHDGYGGQSAINVCYTPGSNYVTNNTDCNDNNINIHPGAQELCSFTDENCINGGYDGVPFYTYYYDNDNDGYGGGSTTNQCEAPNSLWKLTGGDCDDQNTNIHPGAQELCSSEDEDCDGNNFNGVHFDKYYYDNDHDNYGSGFYASLCTSPAGNYVTDSTDCNDANPDIHPGAAEIEGNLVDEDCDSSINADGTDVSPCNCGLVFWWNPTCHNFNDGSIVGVSNFTCPLVTFTIMHTGSPVAGPFANSFTLTGLEAGSYLVLIAVTNAGMPPCSSVVNVVLNKPPPIAVSFSLAASYHLNDPPAALTGNPPGGNFVGPGVNGNTHFIASSAGVGGPHEITYSYTSPLNCSNFITKLTTVVPDGDAVVSVKVLLSGFYDKDTTMRGLITSNITDTVEVLLASATSPHDIVYSSRSAVSTSGEGIFNFPPAVEGNAYYIVVRHRNSLETWSKLPVTIGGTTSFDFTH